MTVETSDDNDLRNAAEPRAAESGASDAKTGDLDPDLALVIERWDSLPEPVKAGILAMVKAAG